MMKYRIGKKSGTAGTLKLPVNRQTKYLEEDNSQSRAGVGFFRFTNPVEALNSGAIALVSCWGLPSLAPPVRRCRGTVVSSGLAAERVSLER